MEITNVKATDLEQLMKIEQAGFTPDEAATKLAMKQRIEMISDSFLVARTKKQVMGFVNGPVIKQRYLTDDLFTTVVPNQKTGGFQSILGLAVAPQFQHQKVASELLTMLAQTAKDHRREGITLTCLARLVNFYEQNGYTDEGISSSTHGGEVWHNMVMIF
ncbi:GNAT family N-acetyltransferase [Paucilactobacillus kaifaensis]|uniref:GNAT family N-acetyltransferase n=1 Tax=Paucilactobacillus kaifaensis TaxID=2559921 RepID=UPI0010F6E4FD|nr:GNAT family N-acetyltransferase [Paucilactobacillus kaifaensis]